MSVCPTCKATFETSERYCPFDGTPLDQAAPANPPGADARATDAGSPEDSAEPRATRALKPVQAGADPLLGKLIDNRYRVRSRLGEGGVGVVYKAEHIQIRRQVAVKVLHPHYAREADLRLRFAREAQAASELSHPGFVQVIDFGTFEGRPFLVMEFVSGELLRDRLDRAPCTPAEAVPIVLEILAALGHAHTHGIIHRDIKPSNVMLCDKSSSGAKVKILDFGLAKSLTPEGQASSLTRTGMVIGTPGYLPPEQALGDRVDERGDLYSVGVVLFEMLCGRKPFVHSDDAQLFQAHLVTPPPRVRSIRAELSTQIDALVARALEKDRSRRFQTAAEFIAALTATPEAKRRGPAAAADLGRAQTVLAMASLPAPTSIVPPRDQPEGSTSSSERSSASGAAGETFERVPGPPRARRWKLVAAAAVLLTVAGTVLVIAFVRGKDVNRAGAGAGTVEQRPAQALPPAEKRPQERRPEPETPPSAEPRRSAEAPPVAEPRPAVAAPTNDRNRTAAGTPYTATEDDPSPALRRAEDALAAGRFNTAVWHARDAVTKQRSSARPHVVLGDAYYGMMWYTDALEEYARAIQRRAELRSDAQIINRAVRCLAKVNVWRQASSFLVETIGSPAVPALTEAAARSADADLRRRAAAVLERMGSAAPPSRAE